MRETTPCVTDTESPPTGYPMTDTSAWRRGSVPNCSGSGASAQKASSSTARSEMSHSAPTASTLAEYFASSPRLDTEMEVECSTECALDRSRRRETMNADDVDAYCLRRDHLRGAPRQPGAWHERATHGRLALGSVWLTNSLHTASASPRLSATERVSQTCARQKKSGAQRLR